MKKKVGIFGGTFDPVHMGHLNLAVELMEAHGLEEVWFIPARVSPHKQDRVPTESKHRLAMLKLATEGHSQFKVLDMELDRDGPSYTVDTLRALSQMHPQNKFYLLLGDDCIAGLGRWHQADELCDYAELLIACRRPSREAIDNLPGGRLRNEVIGGLTPTPILDIEATRLRHRLAGRQYCDHLIPGKVLDYINSNDLYLTDYQDSINK